MQWRRGVGAVAVTVFACVACAYAHVARRAFALPTDPTSTAFMELRAVKRVPRVGLKARSTLGRASPHLAITDARETAEDAAFYQHEGVDYDELQQVDQLDWSRGQLTRGASTITQQLAKNLYLSPSRNPLRKFRELIIARRLEAELTKARIFELYLNVIEFGDGIYGVEAAAQTYFHQPAARLDASQAALLAGSIINPRLLNPARPTPRLLRVSS